MANRDFPWSWIFAGTLALCGVVRATGLAQVPPPSAPAPMPSPASAQAQPASTPSPSASLQSASASASAQPTSTPGQPANPIQPSGIPPQPESVPTQPPIIIEPPSLGVAPGIRQTLHVQSVLGAITLSGANPAVVDTEVDQVARTISVTGKQVGSTSLTVRDSRGLTREVPITVAYPAGVIPDTVTTRITGNPATPYFIKEQALQAALQAVQLRPDAQIVTAQESLRLTEPLEADDITTVDVPLIVRGSGYLTAQGVIHVRVENIALPPIRPAYLMVSDFPETLTQNGLLFEADLSSTQAARFLYYHNNPPGQPDRRVVLKLQNASSQPANVQFISGMAGPAENEMQVGHLSTQAFLVRNTGNEGSVITIPGKTTAVIVDQALPARSVVSNIMQLREISGAPLHLRLLAEDADGKDPLDATTQTTALLSGNVRHARGIYPIPEFFFDYQYDTAGSNLEVPIGQMPLPELKQGEALAGDYGVLQSITVRIINPDPHTPASVALYANPRGGRATGTFIIDGVLVQAHGLPSFSHVKLREYTIPPGGFVRTTIVTMPEGGSSYPLNLLLAPDDGGTSPGAPNSLVY